MVGPLSWRVCHSPVELGYSPAGFERRLRNDSGGRFPVKKRFSFALLVAGALTATALLFASGSAAATTTDVYCPGDSLQSAIDNASTGDTLRIHGVCYGNFQIDGGIADGLTLQGYGSGATLDGQGNGEVLDIVDRSVTLQNLTIRNGVGDDEGGGIDIDGYEDGDGSCGSVVSLIGVKVTLNRAVPGSDGEGAGGGIAVYCATLNLTNSVVSWNKAEEDGGGIEANFGSIVNITGSTVTHNSAGQEGGGIALEDSQLTATASTVSLNESSDSGGGMAIETSDVLLTSTRVTSNKSQYGGGGIYDEGGSPECITTECVEPCTDCVKVPLAPIFGAPLVVGSGLTIVNSSVDHNIAKNDDGGGIYNNVHDTDEGDSSVTIQGSVCVLQQRARKRRRCRRRWPRQLRCLRSDGERAGDGNRVPGERSAEGRGRRDLQQCRRWLADPAARRW